ncbi:SDR family oxidoreductase [Mycobacterium sp. AZCC_0083]|uniref:SDR family oxidoreductase n=1 Tax=Mycobacterium sp. AZCC_0083 TaxID=2735882 RepID=UPI00160E8CB4
MALWGRHRRIERRRRVAIRPCWYNGHSNRLGVPEDLAAMVTFLFSDDGAYVNGQTIVVDGGANFT